MLGTEEFQVSENLLTMRLDICELWYSNAFCVDAEVSTRYTCLLVDFSRSDDDRVAR